MTKVRRIGDVLHYVLYNCRVILAGQFTAVLSTSQIPENEINLLLFYNIHRRLSGVHVQICAFQVSTLQANQDTTRFRAWWGQAAGSRTLAYPQRMESLRSRRDWRAKFRGNR